MYGHLPRYIGGCVGDNLLLHPFLIKFLCFSIKDSAAAMVTIGGAPLPVVCACVTAYLNLTPTLNLLCVLTSFKLASVINYRIVNLGAVCSLVQFLIPFYVMYVSLACLGLGSFKLASVI